jgi:hypothetical protein
VPVWAPLSRCLAHAQALVVVEEEFEAAATALGQVSEEVRGLEVYAQR